MMKRTLPEQSARLQHFMYETEGWARLLSFCKEDLLHFKSRLATIAADNTDEESLVVERFGQEFSAQERAFQQLSEDLKTQDKLLQKDLYVDGELFKEVVRSQIKLRREIKKAEAQFTEMKNRYAQFLNEWYWVEAG